MHPICMAWFAVDCSIHVEACTLPQQTPTPNFPMLANTGLTYSPKIKLLLTTVNTGYGILALGGCLSGPVFGHVKVSVKNQSCLN